MFTHRSIKLLVKKSASAHAFGRCLSAVSSSGKAPTSSAEPVPTSEFPLQNEGMKDSPPAVGYNLILQRMANIVLNITDKQQPVKLLHIHPENALLLYMGKQSNVDVTGFSSTVPSKREFSSKSKYAQVDYTTSFSELETLPYRSGTFEIVLHCLPVMHLPEGYASENSTSTMMPLLAPPALPLSELVRILNHKGFLILGLPEALWESYQMQDALDAISTGVKAQGELLIMQKVPLLLKDLEAWKDSDSAVDVVQPDLMEFDAQVTLATTRTANARYTSTSSIDPSSLVAANAIQDKRSIKYLLAVFRNA